MTYSRERKHNNLGISNIDPAIAQLREIAGRKLNRIVSAWLVRCGFAAIRRLVSELGPATYVAYLGREPFALPILVRVYQRRNRLQDHHVDAFYGAVVRQGYAGGILVTTGGFSRPSVRLTAGLSPRIRLLCGSEWVTELARCKAGVGRSKLHWWVVDLVAYCAPSRNARKARHASQ